MKPKAVVLATALVLAGSVVTGVAVAQTSHRATARQDKALTGSVSVLYTYNYLFNSVADAKTWWSNLAKEWKAKYPNVKLNLIGVGGTDVDLANKAALLFRSKSQAPDVVQIPTADVAQFGGSGYLLPLDSFVKSPASAPFWARFPQNVKASGTFNGSLYAINDGFNASGLLYNKGMLTKAGVKLPWNPKSWAEILDVAKKVKASNPGVIPLWDAAGVAPGPFNLVQGIGNMIVATKQPTMFDAKTQKWVVKSSAIVAALKFYKTIAAGGLGAPTSELFRPDAIGRPPTLMSQGKIAIAFGQNWYPVVWADPTSYVPWPAGLKEIGVAPVPSPDGSAPHHGTTLAGWSVGVGAFTKNKPAAWALVKMMMEPNNLLTTGIYASLIPPDPSVQNLPKFLNYASPFQKIFNQYSKFGQPLPTDQNFPIYARGVNAATGELMQHPSATVDDALKILRDTVVQQLGSDKVEELP